MHVIKKVLFGCLLLCLAREVIVGQPFTEIGISVPPIGSGNVVWGDFDNDAQMDLLVTSWFGASGTACKIFHKEGGNFREINAPLPVITYGYATWVDYNNDGYLDIFLSAEIQGERALKIYRNQGGGTFVDAQASLPFPSANRNASGVVEFATWGDFDNDGDPDLLAHAGLVCRNDANGRFTDVSAGLPLLLDSSADWGDFDNDGDLDILVSGTEASQGGVHVKVFRNDDEGVFAEVASQLPGVRNGTAIWGDYDNDRRLDIFLMGWTSANNSTIYSKVFHNEGSELFRDAGFVLPAVPGAVKWVDYDHDGFMDLFFANNYMNAPLYRNLNGASFSNSGIIFPSYQNSSGLSAWGDYDGDGDLDLFLSPTTNSLSKIQQNEGPLNVPPAIPTGLNAQVIGNQVLLSWNSIANDHKNITYNIRMGRTPEGVDVVSPLSDPKTGIRRLQSPGNAQRNLSRRIRRLTPGTYYWSVQSLDSTLQGSGFAPEQTFVIADGVMKPEAITDPATEVSRFDARLNGLVYPNRSETSVFFEFGADTNYGAIVAAGQFLGGIVATHASAPISNLVQGTWYHYRVAASNNTGLTYGRDRTFRTLNNSPSLSGIGNMTFPAPQLTISTNVIVSDPESSPDQLVLTGRSSNTNLVPDADIVFSGTGSNRTVSLSRLPDRIGSATITVTVTDPQGAKTSRSFAVSIAFFTRTAVLGNGGVAAWGDYDNDGNLDVLKSHMIWRNNGNHTFSNTISFYPLYGWSIAWGDYDNNGFLDILMAGGDQFYFFCRLLRNNGNRTFATNQLAGLPAIAGGSLAWGDSDNDGDLDILLTGTTNATGGRSITRIYRNNGDQTFTGIVPDLPGVELSSVAWGDYNNDGRLDFIVTGLTFEGPRICRIYHNNGDGTFRDIQAGLPGVTQGPGVAWGDYDNDGYLDVLLSGSTSFSNLTRVYHNNRDGTFTDIGAGLPGLTLSSVAWGDFNNDGYLDILLAGRTNTSGSSMSRVYVNNGNGTFTDLQANLAPLAFGSVAWGDYDNDGKLDIVQSWDGTTSVYRNNSLVSNSPPSSPSNLQAKILAHNNVILTWNPATDNETTNSSGLYYNLRLGTVPGGMQLFSPQSDLATGRRRLPAFGNAGHTNQWLVANLPRGAYYWSVQAIDTGFAGSPFSPEVSFTITNDLDFVSNQPPVAYNQSLSVTEDTEVSLSLSGSDPDNDVLSYSILNSPSHGTLRGVPPALTYIPATNYFGPDGFDFRVRDGLTNSLIARITITVTPVQDSGGLGLTYTLSSQNIAVWISGEPYQGYALETSTNLISWHSDRTYTNSNFINGFSYSRAQSAQKFFRVRVIP